TSSARSGPDEARTCQTPINATTIAPTVAIAWIQIWLREPPSDPSATAASVVERFLSVRPDRRRHGRAGYGRDNRTVTGRRSRLGKRRARSVLLVVRRFRLQVCPGLKRIALQTSSIATCRTPRSPFP